MGRGNLAVFGYPISRPFYQNGYLVQYFERARLEWHAEAEHPSPTLMFGLLGAEKLSQPGEMVNAFRFERG